MKTENQKNIIRHSLQILSLTLCLVIFSIFYLDNLIANFFSRHELQTIYYYSREITNIGYSIHYFLIALACLVFSKWIYPKSGYFKNKLTEKQNRNAFQWSLFTIKALVLIGISVQILKLIIGRKRPHVSENFGPLNFDPFSLDPHWHSMPSGHAQVLFTVATIALLIWPKQKYLFLGLALILTFTRVTILQHFFSDVVAGAVLGYLGTLWLYHLWSPAKPSL